MAVTFFAHSMKGERLMADYNRSEAYDLSLYDMPAMRTSAAPQIERPAQRPAQQKRTKSAAQARKESIESAKRAVKLFAVSLTLIVLFGAVLLSNISLIMLENEAAAIETQIGDAVSENTRLVVELNSKVSLEKVEDYAVSVLGMNKLERYQVHYFGNGGTDKVVLADGVAVEDGARGS